MGTRRQVRAGDLVAASGQRGVCRLVTVAARKRDAVDDWLGGGDPPTMCVVERCFDPGWRKRSDLAAVSVDLCNPLPAAIATKATRLLAAQPPAAVSRERLASAVALITNLTLRCTATEARAIRSRIASIDLPQSATAVARRVADLLDLDRMRNGLRFTHTLQLENAGFRTGRDGVRLITGLRLVPR